MTYDEPMSERDLRLKIDKYLESAHAHIDTEIAAERVRGYKYYYGERLGNEKPGRSQHVSRDVFDAVESVKAVLLQTFNASEQVVGFEPRDEDDVLQADLATKYVNDVFYRKCDGYNVLHDAIHDGLVAKLGVVKCFWESKTRTEIEVVENVAPEAIDMLLAQNDDLQLGGEITMVQQADGSVLASAELVRTVDESCVCMEVVPPERFYVDPEADSLGNSRFVADVSYLSYADMRAMGISVEQLEGLSPERGFDDGWEEQARERDIANLNLKGEHYRLFECFVRCDLDAVGEESLYQVLYCQDKVLRVTEVDRHPFFGFTPFRLPHQVYGLSLADTLHDIQKTRSTLQRLIIDNQARANTSRVVANLSLIKNPRELVDNNIGGVVNASDPSAVVPMPHTPLAPATFQVDEMLAREKEARSGASRVAMGLDPNALAGNNSGRLIEEIGARADRKIMTMARNVAENLLRPLMNEIYRLALLNETKPMPIRYNGTTQMVVPSQLGERGQLSVRVALTPDESQDHARALLALHQLVMQDPLYGDRQRYALLAEATERLGVKNVAAYLMNPQDPEYQQMQQMQSEQQAMMQQAQTQMAQMQQMMQQAQLEINRLQVEGSLQLKQTELAMKQAQHTDKQELAEDKHEHDAAMDVAELSLEADQKRGVAL